MFTKEMLLCIITQWSLSVVTTQQGGRYAPYRTCTQYEVECNNPFMCMSIHNECTATRARPFKLPLHYCPLQQLLSYILYYIDIIQNMHNTICDSYVKLYSILYLTIAITIIIYMCKHLRIIIIIHYYAPLQKHTHTHRHTHTTTIDHHHTVQVA